LTLQVTAVLDVFITVATKVCMALTFTEMLAGATLTLTGSWMLMVAEADLVGSA